AFSFSARSALPRSRRSRSIASARAAATFAESDIMAIILPHGGGDVMLKHREVGSGRPREPRRTHAHLQGIEEAAGRWAPRSIGSWSAPADRTLLSTGGRESHAVQCLRRFGHRPVRASVRAGVESGG